MTCARRDFCKSRDALIRWSIRTPPKTHIEGFIHYARRHRDRPIGMPSSRFLRTPSRPPLRNPRRLIAMRYRIRRVIRCDDGLRRADGAVRLCHGPILRRRKAGITPVANYLWYCTTSGRTLRGPGVALMKTREKLTTHIRRDCAYGRRSVIRASQRCDL